MPAPLKTAFAVHPAVKLKGYKKDPKTGARKFGIIKELLFGDYIKPYLNGNAYETTIVQERSKNVTYVKVRTRGVDGYLKEQDFQAERVLEVNFVDVGQGDGCHIVTPDDKHFIIDAGPADNMYRFLKWRFNLARASSAPPPFTVVVSHSDSDHYKGFGKIFTQTRGAKQQFSIDRIYHNGLVELGGSKPDSLGNIVSKDGQQYVTDLCDTDAAYKKRAASVTKPGLFIDTMNKSAAPKQSLRLGDAPIYKKGNMEMEILGPVAIKVGGKDALPVFDANKGKTKNGHSVVIKLTIGKLRLLLGGDLNTEAEYHLLKKFSGTDVAGIKKQLAAKNLGDAKRKNLEAQMQQAILKTRKALEVDIAKSCHHGSADFTSEFLKALNPIATVISSGDNEPHTHPRPDTLGTIGKHSRGERSLIFSTELARSGKEFIDITKLNPNKKKERVVTVYGMINVRTDGEKVIVAQKLERKASGRDWDIHELEWDETLEQFTYQQYKKYE
jgi:beta-lactamase superfamily II metal-dependent hydrolase